MNRRDDLCIRVVSRSVGMWLLVCVVYFFFDIDVFLFCGVLH